MRSATLLAIFILFTAFLFAANTIQGDWTAKKGGDGQLYLEMTMGHSNHGFDVAPETLQGMTDKELFERIDQLQEEVEERKK